MVVESAKLVKALGLEPRAHSHQFPGALLVWKVILKGGSLVFHNVENMKRMSKNMAIQAEQR